MDRNGRHFMNLLVGPNLCTSAVLPVPARWRGGHRWCRTGWAGGGSFNWPAADDDQCLEFEELRLETGIRREKKRQLDYEHQDRSECCVRMYTGRLLSRLERGTLRRSKHPVSDNLQPAASSPEDPSTCHPSGNGVGRPTHMIRELA